MLTSLARWPLTNLYAERGRWFLWLPVWFGLGIAVYFQLPDEPSLFVALLVPTAAAALSGALLATGGRWTLASTIVLVASLGFATAKVRTETVRAPVLPVAISDAKITGRIVGMEGRVDGGRRLWVDVAAIRDLPEALTPARIVVYQRKAPEALKIGDAIALTADLRPPSSPTRPGGFDFARQNFFEQIGAVAFTAAPIERHAALAAGEPPPGIMTRLTLWLAEFRRGIGVRIENAVPGETGAIAKALMTGERGAITEATNQAYRDSGIFHILSISGLHMAIMGGSVFAALRFLLAAVPALALRYPVKKWSAATAALAAFAYLLISGGAHATVRSFIMILIMFLAILVDRPALALRNVALAALAILAIAPESLFNAGFQLSFAAVAALLAGYEFYRARNDRRRRLGLVNPARAEGPMRWLHGLWLFVAATVATTLLAGLATAPIAAFHFHHAQLYATATNLIAVPISNLVVMPAALGAFLAMPLGLEAYPLTVMRYGIDAMTAAATWVAGWPGATAAIAAFPPAALMFLLAGGAWIVIWQRRWRWLGLPLIVAGAALVADREPPDLLVGEDGRLVAVRHDGRLSALEAPQTTFALTRWLTADGDTRTPEEARRRSGFRCDLEGCTARLGARLIAVPRSPAALVDDCALAGIIILSFPRPAACRTPALVIDQARLAREGAHAITITGDNRLEIETVAAWRGRRPWTAAGLAGARQDYWRHRYRSSAPGNAPGSNEGGAVDTTRTAPDAQAWPDPLDPEWNDGYPLYWGRGR